MIPDSILDRLQARLLVADAIENRAKAAVGPFLIDLHELAQREPPPPRFIVDGWLPEGEVTLFAGHGGSGKSLVALTVAVCIAAGRAFFGLPCERRRVLFLSFEDDEAVLHWRLSRVCAMLGVELASLAGWLFLFDATAEGQPLFIELRDGATPSAAMDWLREQIAATRAEVLLIDGTSDAFAANENSRPHVRAFVREVRSLLPSNGAAVLLHHLDAASAHGGSSKGYSGSTAWHNSCRARWYLKPTDDGDDTDQSRVTLEVRKSNHGKAGTSLPLRFSEEAHCFVTDAEMPTSALDRGLRDVDEREAVLRLIRQAEAQGDPLPAATNGTRTVYSTAVARSDFPESLRGRAGRSRFLHHVEALRQGGAVRAEASRKSNGHGREVLRASA